MTSRRVDDPEGFEPRHHRRNNGGLIGYLEDRVSRGAKIALGLGAILSFVSAVTGAWFLFDARFVHSEVYAADMNTISERLDRFDLRVLEGQLRSINAQILDLERLKTLTPSELTFLKQLRSDQQRLEADIREIRTSIQEQTRRQQMGRGR